MLKKGEIKTGSDLEASMRKGAINYDIIKNNRSLPQFITESKKMGSLNLILKSVNKLVRNNEDLESYSFIMMRCCGYSLFLINTKLMSNS